MCKCTPNIKTPFCGKPGCRWPELSVEAELDRIERMKRQLTSDYERNMKKLNDDLRSLAGLPNRHAAAPTAGEEK